MRTPIIAVNLLLLPLSLALTGCGKPALDVAPTVTTIGQATPVAVHVYDPHGVSKLTASVAQNGAQYQVWQSPTASKSADTTFNFDVGAKTTPQLRDGSARLIIEATSGGLFHSTTHWEREVNVITQPPVVSADSDQHYLYLGTADLATINVTGPYTSANLAQQKIS